MRAKELADLVGYSEQSIKKYLREKKLQGIKLGRIWLVAKEDWDAFIERSKV